MQDLAYPLRWEMVMSIPPIRENAKDQHHNDQKKAGSGIDDHASQLTEGSVRKMSGRIFPLRPINPGRNTSGNGH